MFELGLELGLGLGSFSIGPTIKTYKFTFDMAMICVLVHL